jgi:hypothetical protein
MSSLEDTPEAREERDDEGATRPLAQPRGSVSGFAGRSSGWWSAVALLVFVVASLFVFRGLVGRDLRAVVPTNVEQAAILGPSQTNWEALAETDMRFIVWMVARGAHSLLDHPANFFEGEQCHPALTSLAYGESGLAQAILAVPFYLLTGDPIATFNGMLILSTLMACFAMYLLVREWTACPPAGIVAGLFYAFNVMKIGDMAHIMLWETMWTPLAILFATRLFARGRWRDTVGLAICIAMQVAGSAYPLLAAMLLALPIIAWLVLHYGFRHVRLAQLCFVVAFVVGVALLALGPYLAKSGADQYEQAPYLAFMSLSYFTEGEGFPGWVVLGLMIAALVLGRRRTMLGLSGDPRWAVLAGGLLVFGIGVVWAGEGGQRAFAIVPGQDYDAGLFNLYLLLADWIPALGAGRGSGAVCSGMHVAISLLAGIGAAGVLRCVPDRRLLAAALALLALTWIDVLRPSVLGLTPSFEFSILDIEPDPDALALFATLEREGDTGALLEYPLNHINYYKAAKGVLLTAYHHRPTSYCYNSVMPEVSREVEVLAKQLPDEDALRQLRSLGFTTLVVHHAEGQVAGAQRRGEIESLVARQPGELLVRIAGNDSLTAYRMLP